MTRRAANSMALDALCRTAHAAGKVVLWDGRRLSTMAPPMSEQRRAEIEAAIARAKQPRRRA